MKSYFFILPKFYAFGLALLLLSSPASLAGVANTKHDFFPADRKKNCSLCHIPHVSKGKTGKWESEIPTAHKTRFSMMPKEEKVLCLSCHDGVIAQDIGIVNSLDFLNPYSEFEREYTADGLISRTYSSGIGLFNNSCEKHYSLLSNTLRKQEIEIGCSFCHDVHNRKGTILSGLIKAKAFQEHKKNCSKCHKKAQIEATGENSSIP